MGFMLWEYSTGIGFLYTVIKRFWWTSLRIHGKIWTILPKWMNYIPMTEFI